jgi:polyhydroxyalkanoate synthesis regulator phasin
MIELFKKTMLMGVGLAAMTKDRVEEMAREVAKSADMSADKGQQFVREVLDRAEKARDDFESTVQKAVNDNLRKTDLPTRDDIERLNARLERLEQTLASKSQ